jgi:molybdenum storage protein
MTKLVTGDGRTHIDSMLMRESLVDRRVVAKTHARKELKIMPDVVLVSIGGQSIFDRGRDAILPLVEEIAEARRLGWGSPSGGEGALGAPSGKRYKMVIGVGGGSRVRHTVALALDLGLPVGGVAQLVGAMEEANAVFLNALLAKHGSIVLQREHFWELPLYLDSGKLPIAISMPPYHFWEPPPEGGPLPAHGSDFGLFQHAEVLGTSHIIYVKDEDGLYDKDPKKHPDARHIPRTTLGALLADMPEELILDRALFDAWKTARHVERVQIVNGLKRGELLRALAGEDNGTVIEKGGVDA